MIRTITEAARFGTPVRADVCVVGSGFAGMELMRSLRRGGLTVAVAEAGLLEFSKRMQELSRFETLGRPMRLPDPASATSPYLAPEHRGEGRLRQFGGNSNIWTGKLRRFEPLDLEERAHVPDSGWPISYEDLRRSYGEVERDYNIPDLDEESAKFDALRRRVTPEISVTCHHWLDSPIRVPKRMAEEVRSDPGIDLVLGANAVELVRVPGTGRIARLCCRSLDGEAVDFEANAFVLAIGGLETPRLLLASNRHDPKGIGNAEDLVGRYFQDHPKLKRGRFKPGPTFAEVPGGADIFPRPRTKVAFSLSQDVQSRQRLLNHTLQLSVPPGPARGWRRLMQRMRSGAPAFKVSYICEQAPNRDSRVTLSDEADALGMRRIRADWRLTDLDRRSFAHTLDLLTDALSSSGLGTLDFGPSTPQIDESIDCFHHIGTARMGASSQTGVVDPDCRVYGTDNLYVAGSAVFPTGHSYGPTLTILVIARRVAESILRNRQRLSA